MTTSVIKVSNKRGDLVVARALLDSCSTVNLITERFANLLNLPRQTCSVNIGAVDGLCTVSNYYIKTTFYSNYNDSKYELNFLIVPNIAEAVPNEIFPRELFNIPKNVRLADPQFHVPGPIDILLASNTTLSILAIGQIKLQNKKAEIILQKTSLGWIVAGRAETLSSSIDTSCNIVKLDKLIERFWFIEDFDHEPVRSRDEVACEQHYVTHTKRDINGRYVVRLPFRDSKFNLGNSKMQALKRFHALERKFESNPSLKTEYTKVMEEYISLGHMSISDDNEGGYYLPHHAVIKESSETTKVRIVFDASAKTSTGISLNDTLMVGPTIQNTIFQQLLKFRTHPFVITADIEKMYRQILVHPEDRKFQKTLWYHQGKIRTFQLNTVTFGTAAAPFLAIRTIQQLAHDEAEDFPRASKLLLRDFYVDDFISGAGSLQDILSIRDEMIELLNRGGFAIRKWASNHQLALEDIDEKFFNLDCVVTDKPIQKTLGIVWDSQGDFFKYTIQGVEPQLTSTKRKLLSEISKIYDPLGLLGPISLYAKVLIQDCWKSKITWDESLPQEIYTKWKNFANQLPLLEKIVFPRKLLIQNAVKIELHGFCDASLRGYGACLFLRSENAQGHVTIRLVCSKSRVAPLSGITIPRLELCAASVLKKLYIDSKSQFDFPLDQVTLWSDSTIVLAWLKKAPHLLRTFESNRVSDIQSLGDQVRWFHVASEDNPADALSRGQLPFEFINNSLWTSGPKWLVLPESNWPKLNTPLPVEVPGIKRGLCLLTTPPCSDIYLRFSQFDRLVRVVAYIRRWKRPKSTERVSSVVLESLIAEQRVPTMIRSITPLSCSELAEAEQHIILMIQQERFAEEFKHLSKMHDKSSIFRKGTPFDKLHPFIDNVGLIRVGGRLKNSNLPYGQKHPVLLPNKHPVTDLIIQKTHQANAHAGIQSTLYDIQRKYWILNGKDQVRSIVRRCIECIRQKPKIIHAQMADLPKERVHEAPAFCHTGVDFFGPILIKEKKDRNRSFIKTYGCVFICMVSKAVHIELATDLSTEGFLSAFRRFIGRRGVPEHVYSDNGRNFVGANNEIREIYDLLMTPTFKDSIRNYALSKRIEWHFTPPLSPHFGGIWEAAVKSFKHHLRRVLKDQKLTYEQINTLLIEIEAILNSRPLCTLSADPNDPLAITPAHFLIGRPFNFLPEKNLVSVPDNRLSTYNFIIKARQDFWNKWHKEYLHELQTRQKWHESTAELKTGSVVIMMDDVTTCARWPLGVIIEVFPGNDGIARVAMVKTASGIYKRNITRLCILPIT